MKLIVLALAFVGSVAFGEEKIVSCDATDSNDNSYSFKFNVTTGEIRKTVTESAVEKVLYAEATKCGLAVGLAKCEQKIVHNFDQQNQPYFAVSFKTTCTSVGGRPLRELNGSADINSFGDGTGTFVCGMLSSDNLSLSNCVLSAE